MRIPTRFYPPAWVAVPLCALGFLLWIDVARIRHVDDVSAIGDTPSAESTGAGSAAGGDAGWRPRLIVPEHNNPTYEWLDQTRQMFARHEWRVRQVDYENAPFGHAVFAASPYRWWLGLLAWCDRLVSHRPIGAALERAALFADPLIHLLLLVGTTIFVARRFGAVAGALLATALVVLFPFAAEFIPGMPEDRGLAEACAIWSVLPLLAGVGGLRLTAADAATRAARWFFVAGIVGGLGLWIGVSKETPVLAGIAVGALVAAGMARGDRKRHPASVRPPLPWRAWGLGGAASSFAAYLVEFAPAHLGVWQLRAIHPLYSLAWLGGGELLTRTTDWIENGKTGRRLRDLLGWILAVAAVAGLPVAMRLTHNLGFLETDLPAFRLARLPTGPAASNFFAWVLRDGFTAMVWTTILPLLLIGPAIGLLLRRTTGVAGRLAIAIALGPVLVELGFACRQLNAWNGLDAMLLVLLVATTVAVRDASSHPAVLRWWSGFVVLAVLPGAIQILPRTGAGATKALNPPEVYGLIERDLARWMATRMAGRPAVVLAPHNQATTLYYYGGLRGLATLAWENRDGLEIAVRITSASTPEEAKALIDRRGVTDIVIPSWDAYLDSYARMGMGELDGTFMRSLHDWKLPPWLRPIPYQLPTIPGFEGQSVTVFEVVDDQDDAVAWSRLAEYFVEMGQLDHAASVGQALRRFPADLGALVARAEVDIGRGDRDGFKGTVDLLRPRLASGADRSLPWDRRLALAVVLTQAKYQDLARDRVRRCIAEADETKLRSLSTGALYRLLVLSRAYGFPIADLKTRELALSLLPEDMRRRL